MYRKIFKYIVGGKISQISRVCNLICISIESCGISTHLHIQTFFRVLHNGKVVISSEDIYKSDGETSPDCFSWDVPGNSLFDKSLLINQGKWFDKKITDVQRKRNKDLKIVFDDKYVLEIFVDTVSLEEKYRIFNDYNEGIVEY